MFVHGDGERRLHLRGQKAYARIVILQKPQRIRGIFDKLSCVAKASSDDGGPSVRAGALPLKEEYRLAVEHVRSPRETMRSNCASCTVRCAH